MNTIILKLSLVIALGLPFALLAQESSDCPQGLTLFFPDHLGHHRFLATDTLETVREVIKHKISLKQGKESADSWNPQMRIRFTGPMGIFPPETPLTEAGILSDQTVRFFIDKVQDVDAVKTMYDVDVAPVLKNHLTKKIDKILKKDGTKIVMIGLASSNFSGDDNQQFPEFIRKRVKGRNTPVTIFLIDGAFAKTERDSHQIYGNGAFGMNNWKMEVKETKAKGKVRVFVNKSDFGSKVTIRVYGTNVLSREWKRRQENPNPTLLGDLSLIQLKEHLAEKGIPLVVGDFHRSGEFPDILSSLEDLEI